MKVLLVASKFPPEYSGSGLRAHATYLRLAEKFDIQHEVICSSVEFTDRAEYRSDGVPVIRVVSPVLRKLNRAFGKGLLRRFTNAVLYHSEARTVTKLLDSKDFDLIHVFGYSPATIAAINWSRRKSIPLILEIVNNVVSPFQYLPGTRRFRSYDLGHQSVVVAISQHIADQCKSAGLIENVWTRPNPVDTVRFSPASQDQRAKVISRIFGFSGTVKTIVYVAKFMKQKNHEFLVEVMKHLPTEYKLVLAGPTVTSGEVDPGMRSEQIPLLQSHIDHSGLGSRIKVIPEFVDTAEFLAGADVFCFPAENEAMGTPLIEALSSGTPVIANANEPSFTEWIINGENGFLAPLIPEQWASNIQTAACYSEGRRTRITRSIKDRISTETIDEYYVRLMTALVESKPGDRIQVAEVLNR